jgi:two-component system LytT family response regulator
MIDAPVDLEMGKLRTLIVEDDPVQRIVTRGHVERLPALQLVGVVPDVKEAERSMAEGDIDLLILDIGLPGESGYQFLQRLPSAPATIVTTADPGNALEGFEHGVVDLLVKPFSFERFVQAAQRVGNSLIGKQPLDSTPPAIVKPPVICLACGRRLVTLPINDILVLEALGNHVKVDARNERLLATATMKSMERELKGHGFVRIHRRFIVSGGSIEAVVGAEVITQIGAFPVGNLYRRSVLELLATRERLGSLAAT